MSSIATFFRTLPDTLQQPIALAMLGSVGAHLIIFATLPAFTSSTEPRPEAEVRRVRLLEPPQGTPNSQIARSQIGLPPIPNTPNSKLQLPATGGNSPLPNPLYTIPDLTPVPVPNTPAPQLSTQDRFNELLRRIALRQQQQQQPVPKPPKPPSPPASPAPTIAPGTNLKPFDPSVLADQPGTQPSATTPQPPTTPSPAPTSTPQAPTNQPEIDRNNQLLAATRYIAEGTTQQDNIQASQKLTEQMNAKNVAWEYIRLRQPQEPIRELDYPLAFALQNFQQHPAAIAVLIGKDGKPLPNQKPTLLSSTGYQILNDKAIEIVQNEINQPNKFPAINEEKIRVYVYEFQFKAPKTQPVS